MNPCDLTRKSLGRCGLAVLVAAAIALIPAPGVSQEQAPVTGAQDELVVIQKVDLQHPNGVTALPPGLTSALGSKFIDYEAFVAARLPSPAATSLRAAAWAANFPALVDLHEPVVLPFHSFAPENPAERTSNWLGGAIAPEAIPGLFLVRFGYPILDQWQSALAGCAKPLLYFGNRVFLVSAPNTGAISNCAIGPYVSWVGPWLNTDRISPDTLAGASAAAGDYWMQFLPGVSANAAAAELPASAQVTESYSDPTTGSAHLRVSLRSADVVDFVRTNRDLLSCLPYAAGEPSDERQGQIIAGNYTGTQVINTGYLSWLTSKSLSTASNQQTIALFDTGYSTDASGLHHPQLLNPNRLLASKDFTTAGYPSAVPDELGHGTFNAGIVAGDGTQSSLPAQPATQDQQGFFLGTGIAPQAKVVAAKIFRYNSQSCSFSSSTQQALGDAFNFVRTSGGADLATIANHSWNGGNDPNYDQYAQMFDQRVIDADSVTPGNQPMTLVVSAGNSGPGSNAVYSPATAKDVIAVGATQNYRPLSQAGEPTNTCDTRSKGALQLEDAVNIANVSTFSGRGLSLGSPPHTSVLTTRIKPDLVAPGGKVFSLVPYNTDTIYTLACFITCYRYWLAPGQASNYQSYGQGTSYAAPVASGAAALVRKWFLDHGTNPSPSLVKASLIATADDLGAFGTVDYRPSNAQGWGRINLNKFTDSAARFYVTDNAGLAVGTGGQQSWTRTIDDPAKDTYVVLVWSDPASSQVSGQQAPLVNDLLLNVFDTISLGEWQGNNFHENSGFTEDGYSAHFVPPDLNPVGNDTANTVEAVFIKKNTFPAGSQVTIRVTGVNVPSGPQKFAIYAYNVRPTS